MPRTKVVKKRRVTQDSNVSRLSTCQNEEKAPLDEFKQRIEDMISFLDYDYQMKVNTIKQFYKKVRLTLVQNGLANKTLKEIMSMDTTDCSEKSANKENRTVSSLKNKNQRPVRKRSNSCSTRPVLKKTPIIRSVSAEKFKTPLNRNIPSIPMVTPKVNPNAPLSVLRRPRQGEFAMSMSGSPLMVSTVAYDEMASVSVPLPDGTVLSILPTKGIDAVNLPLDENTRKQLLKLKSNLTKCLQK